jgi:6-pyruvoyltetrahydropterin/6-carboxytetrahydropterin synthase
VLTVTKRFRFDAAHKLPFHEGKCRNLHGHTYTLEIEVEGDPVRRKGYSSAGMIIDFTTLGSIVKAEILNELDHQYLNEVIEWEFDTQPTAEELVMVIVRRLQEHMGGWAARLQSVTLYETPDNWATWRREDAGT